MDKPDPKEPHEMPHNHPPRCCCKPDDMGRGIILCPSCVEHGELASLNSAPNIAPNIDGDQCPEESPSTGARCFLKVGHPGAHLPAECPSCHAVGDQPHTDYCRRPDARHTGDRMTTGQTSQPPTHTSQPATQIRGCLCRGDLHEECATTLLATPTPGQCTSCHRDYDHTPAPTCRYPRIP